MLLTDAQIQAIRQIIADHHAAFIANMIDPKALSAEMLEKLKALGLVNTQVNSVEDAYLYGQILAATNDPKVQTMDLGAFKNYLRRNPVPLTPVEHQAIAMVRQQAAQYVSGLGNRVSTQTGQILIDADHKLRRKMRDTITRKTEQNITSRETVKQLKSDLGWAAKDWTRDLDRIAITEKQAAMEQGKADRYAKDHGPDVWVAKVSAPDCCFVPGTLVITARGKVAIEEVRLGDQVLTHRMRWRSVTRVMQRKYQGYLYGMNGRPNATSDHPFLVNMNWRTAKTVQPGDQIVQVVGPGDAEDEPTLFTQKRFTLKVATSDASTSVPVASVDFYRYLQVRESEIDVETSYSEFRDAAKRFEKRPHNFSCLRHIGSAKHFLAAQSGLLIARVRGLVPPSILSSLGAVFTLRSGAVELSGDSGALDGSFEANTRFGETPAYSRNDHAKLTRYAAQRSLLRSVSADNTCGRNIVPVGGHSASPVDVKFIETAPYAGIVFNLEVCDDNSYTADGQIVHNCNHCRRLYVGPDGAPRIFRLAELEANGSNVGRKVGEWRPVVGPTHPHCLPPETLVLTPTGYQRIDTLKPGDYVVTHKARPRQIKAVWSSAYKNDLVHVKTSAADLRLTPNHAVFTGDQWVAAGRLQTDTNIPHHTLEKVPGDVLADKHAENAPPKHSQNVGFARILYGFSTSGVPAAAIDLDGQLFVWEGQVDQKNVDHESDLRGHSCADKGLVDRLLVGRFQLTGLGLVHAEDGTNRLFAATHSRVGGVGNGGPLLSGHSGISRPHHFGLGAQLGTLSQQAPGDDGARNPHLFSHGVNADEIFAIEADHTVLVDNEGARHTYSFDRQSVVAVRYEADFIVSFDHDTPPRTALTCTVQSTHPIASVTREPFFGVVYNLTVDEDESYVAAGIPVHNCVCTMVRVPAGWGFDAKGDLVAGGVFGVRYDAGALEASLRLESTLRKALANSGNQQPGICPTHVAFQGIPLVIEHPAGSQRQWRNPDGSVQRQITMLHAYGYIDGTHGVDGMDIDCYVGPVALARRAFIVHQTKPDGTYDEQKVMLGFPSLGVAKDAYAAHMERGHDAIGHVDTVPMLQLKRWLEIHNHAPILKSQAMAERRYGDRNSRMSGGDGMNFLFNCPQVTSKAAIQSQKTRGITIEEMFVLPQGDPVDRGAIVRDKEDYLLPDQPKRDPYQKFIVQGDVFDTVDAGGSIEFDAETNRGAIDRRMAAAAGLVNMADPTDDRTVLRAKPKPAKKKPIRMPYKKPNNHTA